jgi:CBS domain-containing protein
MNVLLKITATFSLLMFTRVSLAEDVLLPAPVLQWSFYIFLIFALSVAIGIFFIRTKKNIKNEPLSSLLTEPRTAIHSVNPDVSVTECVRQMNGYKIGAMLVMEDNHLLGIFTERDCITKVLGAGLEPTTTKVSDVMTKDPYCVPPSITLDDAMNIITHHRFRHLPVAENGEILGIVSSGDLTHRLVQNKPGEVRELVDIAGRRRVSR